ncbi:RNA polymerase sigma factor [Actinomadura flavalba]|uniref:RNA polymerase sigma factor n=1 Tax=Actinomadura flavalba TaxID=1120938 RepID=UPI000372DB7E|nr:sigma-70 family RNA polymerase sigma factor [Actinomadura flavalba]
MDLLEQADPGDLVRRARRDDEDAWNALVTRYSELLWAVARSCRLGDADCADVVQITWLRLIERLDTLHTPEHVGGWLCTTARRESLRLAAARGLPPIQDVPAAAASPHDIVAARESVCAVATALRRLGRPCRNLLRVLALTSRYSEVAAALGMPTGSVGPSRARCLAALRRELAG